MRRLVISLLKAETFKFRLYWLTSGPLSETFLQYFSIKLSLLQGHVGISQVSLYVVSRLPPRSASDPPTKQPMPYPPTTPRGQVPSAFHPSSNCKNSDSRVSAPTMLYTAYLLVSVECLTVALAIPVVFEENQIVAVPLIHFQVWYNYSKTRAISLKLILHAKTLTGRISRIKALIGVEDPMIHRCG